MAFCLNTHIYGHLSGQNTNKSVVIKTHISALQEERGNGKNKELSGPKNLSADIMHLIDQSLPGQDLHLGDAEQHDFKHVKALFCVLYICLTVIDMQRHCFLSLAGNSAEQRVGIPGSAAMVTWVTALCGGSYPGFFWMTDRVKEHF